MATVRLTSREAKYGAMKLPPVCIVCGEPATVVKSKRMAWHSPWVYALLLVNILVYAIVALAIQKRMRVEAPFCPKHKNHWSGRFLIILLSFLGIAFMGLMLLFSPDGQRPGPRNISLGLAFGGVFVLLLGWLVMVIMLSMTAVRPKEITDRSITLNGVSLRFIDALEGFSENSDVDDADDGEYRRRRSSLPYDDDDFEYGNRARRSRRGPSDAFEE